MVVLGMDGLEYSMLDRMDSFLPNFQRLFREGARGEMSVPPPIMSPILWTTLASGYEAEVHGVGGWTNGRGQAFTGADVRVQRVWDVLSGKERSSVVSGWLMTWPAGPIHGQILSDKYAWSYPMNKDPTEGGPAREAEDWATAWPGSLATRAEGIRPGSGFVEEHPLSYQVEAYGAPYHPLMRDETHVRVFEVLWGEARADFGAVFVNGADQVSHLYWPFTDPGVADAIRADPSAHRNAVAAVMKAHPDRRPPPFAEGLDAETLAEAARWVPDYYRYLDEVLGRVMTLIEPDTTLIVCSDHGFKVSSAQPLVNGSHRDVAVFAAWGARVRPGARAALDVYDAAPTIHALLGLPPAADWTGSVVSEMFDIIPLAPVETYRLNRAAIEIGSGAEATVADQQLREQLEALGYIGEDGAPDPAIGASRKSR